MGKGWDGSGISFDPATWKAFMPYLHDGAFGFAYAGSRGWHRMAVAIEDAGFVIHPTIFTWTNGSGFPKATRIDNQVDKALGYEQLVVGKMKQFAKNGPKPTRAMAGGWNEAPDITAAVSDEAKAWEGHRYGLQAMKPAVEPVILFQKPYSGKPIDNMMSTGAGALNLEAARVGDDVRTASPGEKGKHGIWNKYDAIEEERTYVGRQPPNFTITHGPDCTAGHCLCEAADGAMGEKLEFYPEFYWWHEIYEQLMDANPSRYVPKAGRKERDVGLSKMPLQLMKNKFASHNGTKDYRSFDNTPLAKVRNPHPTAKPLAMNKWLASLLLPPDTYSPRRLLVPFSGSGSEMIGARLAGWEYIQGIEFTEEYVIIAGARLRWWESQMDWHGGDLDKILEGVVEKPDEKSVDDLPIFAKIGQDE